MQMHERNLKPSNAGAFIEALSFSCVHEIQLASPKQLWFITVAGCPS